MEQFLKTIHKTFPSRERNCSELGPRVRAEGKAHGAVSRI